VFATPLTFGGKEHKLEEAKFAVLGVPYDRGESYRTGSRFAPNAIREASIEIESYDMIEDKDLSDIKIFDCGNVDVSGDFEKTFERTKLCISEILKNKAIPIVLGGEHTISLCSISAYREKPFFLVFDAHLDFRDEYLEEKFSHACVTRRIGELIGFKNILAVGVRSASKEELKDAGEHGLEFISFEKCSANAISEKIQDKNVYVSIDMDVLDPKEARGVCNPEPSGFYYSDFISIFEFLKKTNLVGLDIVEVCPSYDAYTPVLAAKLIFKILAKL
jgi:agmatinase